jgi:hypothetical protein
MIAVAIKNSKRQTIKNTEACTSTKSEKPNKR